jgi:hypothetical protein
VEGTRYSFKLRAANSKGNSEFSEELIIAAAATLAKPNAPTRTMSGSTKSSLIIEWSESTGTAQVPVEGYLLYQSEGLTGDYQLIYNGSLNAL